MNSKTVFICLLYRIPINSTKNNVIQSDSDKKDIGAECLYAAVFSRLQNAEVLNVHIAIGAYMRDYRVNLRGIHVKDFCMFAHLKFHFTCKPRNSLNY